MKHFYLYGCPQSAPDQNWLAGSQTMNAWGATGSVSPLGEPFERAMERLRSLPGFFDEADGSFVWVTFAENGKEHVLSGTVFDDGERVQYVEVFGTCASEQWLRFLAQLSPEPRSLAALLLDGERRLIPAEQLRLLWQAIANPV